MRIYSTADVNVALSSLQVGVNRQVFIKLVDMNGKFKINDTSTDILNIQRVDGSLLYDALALAFTIADKTSIFQINNPNILESLSVKACCF